MVSQDKHVHTENDSDSDEHTHRNMERNGTFDIAVIGMSCRFPGARNYREYWSNLVAGVDSVTEIPPDRWDWRDFQGEARAKENKTVSKWGGFVADADKFDAHFFGISPREAECMDPQQRMALELAWQCIEDAGYAPDALSGSNVGVYMGACNFDYKTLQERFCQTIQGHMSTGNFMAVIANRVSYLFNFHGPSITNDTACASSLVAIQQAVNALKAGECDTALAGGVALLATPDRYVAFSKMGMLSPTGRCRTFDESADGYVRAEGAGMVYLKPLAHAQRDGDLVLGVIKGVATNHCGRTRSLTAPSALAQSQVISAALRQAQVSPSSITYVETHGTGTPVGDPIEITGLSRAFTRHDDQPTTPGHCALGAVKTNVGHLEAAAGIAGVIKVLLAMKHGQLPPNLHYSQLNPRIKLEDSPFYVLDTLRPWHPHVDAQGRVQPLRASVNSFGFGGVNAHLILEQASDASAQQVVNKNGQGETCQPGLLVLSARSEAALQCMALQYADLIERDPLAAPALCRQTNTSRAHMPYRFKTLFTSTAELVAALSERGAGLEKAEDEAKPVGTKTVGFLFTGQGAQYGGMARGLYASQPVFKRAFDECNVHFKPFLKQSLVELVFQADGESLNETRYTQPALFAVEYALAKLWAAFGVVPAVAMGHSIGEIVAACVAEALSLPDAVALVSMRARLMQEQCPTGAMATVFASAQDVRALIDQHRLPLDIAAINSPQSTVISGLAAAVSDAVRLFGEAGVDAKPLPVERAFHSHLIEPIQRAFLDHLETTSFKAPSLRVISNVTGEEMKAGDWSARYWVNHARKPVLFMQGVQAMRQAGVDVMIEVGPSPTLVKLARRSIVDDVVMVASLDPSVPDADAFMRALATVYEAGVNLRFDALYEGLPPSRSALPPYPFVGQSYWVTQGQPVVLGRGEGQAVGDPLVGALLDVAGHAGQCFSQRYELNEARCAYLADHCVHGNPIMPGAAYASMGVAAVRRLQALDVDDDVCVSGFKLLKALALDQAKTVQTILKRGEDHRSHVFEVWSRPEQTDEGAERNWTLHASGLVSWGTAESHLGGGMPAMSANLDVQQFYATWQAHGVAYGPGFQVIQAAEVSADQVVADLAVPAQPNQQGEMAWHPALLDGIWQSVLPLLPAAVQASGLVPLPVSVGHMSFKGAIAAQVQVVSRRAPSASSDGTHSFDIDIYTPDGALIGRVQGLRLKPSKALKHSAAGVSHVSDLRFLEPVWYRPTFAELASEQGSGTSQVAVPGMDVIVYAQDSRHLAEHLASRIGGSHVVTIGMDVALPLPGGLAVESSDSAGISQALASCRAVRALYFLGGFQSSVQAVSPPSFDKLQDHGPRALFTVLKTLDAQAAWLDGAVVKVVGNRVNAVHGHAPVVPWGAGCFGVASVHVHENPGLKLANIDLACNSGASDAEIDKAVSAVLAESGRLHSSVAYRDGFRYVRRLEPVAMSTAGDDSPVYRHQGVYLIVGGAGGIGTTLSRHLAGQYQASLVWIGRSELDAAKHAAMDQITSLGGQVTYRQADVRDAMALKAIINDTLSQHGRINGVVHSALSLQDQSMARMDLAQFNAGYDVKAQGSMALVEALDGVQLDFLAFFSSAVSFLGNRGQCNYVAGCVFQDAFAHYLKQAFGSPVKVINWGRWGEVGAVASAAYNDLLDAQGLFAMSPQEGLDAMDVALAGPLTQVAVLRADERPLAQMSADMKAMAAWVSNAVIPVPMQATGHDAPDSLDASLPHPVSLQNGYASLNRLAREFVQYSFDQLAGGKPMPESGSNEAWRTMLGITAAHETCFAAMRTMLEKEGVVSGLAIPSLSHLTAERARMLSTMPWLASELQLLWACGIELPRILTGQKAATSVIFPEMSMALVEGVYRSSPLAVASNRQVARQVAASLRAWAEHEPDRPVRILEIGAGTGGTTATVLEELDRLAPECLAKLVYVYTDISPAFLNRGRELFAQGHPFLRFELLDIEKPMAAQHQKPGSVDLIIASNVLHATHSLSNTLQNVKFLLKQNGMLVLNEVMRAQNFLTMTFGLLDGWWLAEDGVKRLPYSPLLSEELWKLTMADEGYECVSCRIAGVAQEWCQGVLVACSNGRYSEALLAQEKAAPNPPDQRESHEAVAVSVSAGQVSALMAGASVEEVQTAVRMYLRGQLADVLQVRQAQLDKVGRPLQELFLSELGIDSLTAMDLRGRLRAQLGVNVPVEVLLGGTRIAGVIEMICDQLMVRRLMARQESQASLSEAGDAENMESFTL